MSGYTNEERPDLTRAMSQENADITSEMAGETSVITEGLSQENDPTAPLTAAVAEEPTEVEAIVEETPISQPTEVEATVEDSRAGETPISAEPTSREVPSLGDGEPVLSVRNLSKSYKRDEYILKNFSLEIAKGQIVGLLGPNGCGKTTLLKMIAGLLVPDAGTIEIAGRRRSELSNLDISYLPERTYFTPGMRVNALLDYFSDFYLDFDCALAEQMLHDLDIPLDAKLRTLSKGMKEKVQLVLVMSRKTKLYLLDEPIGGVDPAAREYVLNTILSRYNTEASVIITTHLISDVEPVLDTFAFLGYGGELLAWGSTEHAREQTGKSLDELFREVFRCYRKH